MKKAKFISIILLFIIISLLLPGCKKQPIQENTTEATNNTETKSTTSNETETKTEETTETPTNATQNEDYDIYSLSDLAKYFEDNSYVTGEQIEPLYTMIGAIGGFKYLDSNVEVYEYDTSTDAYKTLSKTKSVSGIEVSAINGPYVLIFADTDNINQDLIDAFNHLKISDNNMEVSSDSNSTEVSDISELDKTIDDLASYLEEGGYVTGEQTETFYSMIGATGGYKYFDSNVEIYEYDISSDAYKIMLKTKDINGTEVSAINGQFILISCDGGIIDQKIIDAFNDFK